MRPLSIFLIFPLLLLFRKGQAQEVISSAGAHGTSAYSQLSWTVGEPVVETFSVSSAMLTQGFHQSHVTVTALEPSSLSGVELDVFPNPTASRLIVAVKKGYLPGLRMTLFDSEGKVLLSKTIKNTQEDIELEPYAQGIYLLHIQHPGKPCSQTFRIVKQ